MSNNVKSLSERIVAHCEHKCLELGGIVAELASGQPLNPERALRLVAYCEDRCLELGGLVDEVCGLLGVYGQPNVQITLTPVQAMSLAEQEAFRAAFPDVAAQVDADIAVWKRMYPSVFK